MKTTLTPSERGQLAGQFVRKWGTYASQVYGIDVRTWSKRMVATFVHADPVNFQNALQRSTYEGALATLDGAGHKLSDDKVITALAKSSDGVITPAALGDTTEDLVFTAVEPCRIVDTRGTGAGAIAAGTNRGFFAWGFANFTSQGGSATDCGLTGQSPEAIVVNLTAVAPSQTGFATLYPASGTQPTAAAMIYQAGQVLSNAVTVKLGTTGSVDFRIFSEKTAHYVVDIVGYYDAPHATALDCTTVTADISMAALSTGSATANCPAGYTVTGGGCNSAGFTSADGMINAFPNLNGYFCRTANSGGTPRTGTAYATCCRVPGR
ncbi:hypothetical protein GCM10027430_09230 [Lysobacter tyrosinilyticus]